MNSYQSARGMKRYRIWLGMMALLLLVGSAVALDPVPDYKTLIMPTLVPKSGHGPTPDPGFEAGLIRNAYDTIYEDYWKETSYYQYERGVTNYGEKVRGYYNDTKTYGYAQVPWPLASTNATGVADTPVAAEEFEDGVRLYNTNYVPDGADTDGFWTPGEAFNDEDGDGEWWPGGLVTNQIQVVITNEVTNALAEDFWNADNTNAVRSASVAWLNFLHDEGGTNWSRFRGELYADYEGLTQRDTDTNGTGEVTVFGYSTMEVPIWVARATPEVVTNPAVIVTSLAGT